MINVLVFPCGSEIALEVHRSLSPQKDINLIGVSSVDDHGMFVFDTYVGGSPLIGDENFIKFFQDLVSEYNIDFIEINGVNTITHFKSANWCEWYTENYVNAKKMAITNLLNKTNL
jgi:hypothetical protein